MSSFMNTDLTFNVYEDTSIKPFDASRWPFINVEPREVQLRALSKGYGKEGFAYFMRQRLGKTWVAYAEFKLLQAEDKVDWMVIICPNSIKDQWVQAIEHVDNFIPILVYNSQNKQKARNWFKANRKGGVIIINYESVPTFMELGGWKAIDTLRTYIIADESTKIKEPSNKATKACHEFSSMCAFKRDLAGKPKANSNADLWGQLKFINATDRNFHQHKWFFCEMGGWMGKQVLRDVNTDTLKKEMDPFCYIAEDKYVVGFEKVYEPLRRVILTGDQKRQYEDMQNDLIINMGADTKINAPIALTKYLRLQQIGSGVAGTMDGEQINLIDPFDNPRIRATEDILENECDHKTIIVCRFSLSMYNLQQVLGEHQYKTLIMKGGMSTKEIEDIKRTFNDPKSGYDIIIAQESVLNYGHTLCGDSDDYPCDTVIFYENSFSLLNRAQCESRPEKFDRKKPISYYDLYASKMDKYIMECLRRKEEASMALMNYALDKGIFGDGSKLEL